MIYNCTYEKEEFTLTVTDMGTLKNCNGVVFKYKTQGKKYEVQGRAIGKTSLNQIIKKFKGKLQK